MGGFISKPSANQAEPTEKNLKALAALLSERDTAEKIFAETLSSGASTLNIFWLNPKDSDEDSAMKFYDEDKLPEYYAIEQLLAGTTTKDAEKITASCHTIPEAVERMLCMLANRCASLDVENTNALIATIQEKTSPVLTLDLIEAFGSLKKKNLLENAIFADSKSLSTAENNALYFKEELYKNISWNEVLTKKGASPIYGVSGAHADTPEALLTKYIKDRQALRAEQKSEFASLPLRVVGFFASCGGRKLPEFLEAYSATAKIKAAELALSTMDNNQLLSENNTNIAIRKAAQQGKLGKLIQEETPYISDMLKK